MLEVNLPDGWKMIENGKAIEKVFSFSSFTKAFDFMKSCEPIIDDMDHHPEWTNIYGKVVVKLTTHDTGGLSEKDYVLAESMNKLFKT